MALKGKIQAYCEARANGRGQKEAAADAGYSLVGISQTACRLEARKDVQAEIRRLKKDGSAGRDPGTGDVGGVLDKWEMKDKYASPLDLMIDVMNNPQAPKSLRYQAAKDALPYCHPRKEGGKKDEAKERGEQVAKKSRFKTKSAPSHVRH